MKSEEFVNISSYCVQNEEEMVREHHQFNGREFEQMLGDSEEQGNLACCGPWDRRVGYS